MCEASRESNLTYFKAKHEELEVALSTAVRAAVAEQHPDPILYVSQQLAAAAAKTTGGVGEDMVAGQIGQGPTARSPTKTASQPEVLARDITAEHISTVIAALGFTPQYGGQLMPPKPSAAEVTVGMGSTGPITCQEGLVIQGGPYGSIWLRVGCVDGNGHRAPVQSESISSESQTPERKQALEDKQTPAGERSPPRLMPTLEAYVVHSLAEQRAKSDAGQVPSAVYCALTIGALQSVDLSWLAERGFKFYTYLAAAGTISQPDSSEIVYYAWPGGPAHPDMVPPYATAVEGASGVVLSPDGEEVLLVWERGSWHGPAGAVNPGEGVLNALARETKEELNVDIEVDNPKALPIFLGGYHKSSARGGTVNDNFSAWLVRAKSVDFTVDATEVHHARWFKRRDIVAAWQADGSPTGRNYVLPPHLAPEGRVKIDGKLPAWLHAYEQGLGLHCRVSTKIDGPVTKTTVTIGV